MILLFSQGMIALPAALMLERLRGVKPAAKDNPLWPLVYQILAIQVVALPAVFIVFRLDPLYAPAALAAVGGCHFLPFSWLYGTRAYTVMGIVVSVVPFLAAMFVGPWLNPWIIIGWGLVYWGTAAVLISRSVWHVELAAPGSMN